MDYIYSSRGNAVGYRNRNFIHEIGGKAVGQISGLTHVHKITGQYVGELHEDMVLDMGYGNLGNIGNPGNPGNFGHPDNPGNRGARSYGYKDVFEKLLG